MKGVVGVVPLLMALFVILGILSPSSAYGQSVAVGIGLRSSGDGALTGGVSGRAPLPRFHRALFVDASASWEQGPDTLRTGYTREVLPNGRSPYMQDEDGKRVPPDEARLDGPTALEAALRLGIQGAPWKRKRIWLAAGIGHVSGAINDPETGVNGWQPSVGAGIELAGWTELALDWRSGASGVRLSLQLRPRMQPWRAP